MRTLGITFMLAGIAMAQPLSRFMAPEQQAHESIVFRKCGDQDLKLQVFRPPGVTPGERMPALVCIHGGAWRTGGSEVFFPHAAYFASRGLVAISIDYRLLQPGPDGVSMADCLSDCRSAIRYIRSHAAALGVDANRIGVMGDSAGGHLAVALGTVTGFDDPADDTSVSALPDSMILCNPIVDLTGDPWIAYIIRGRALDRNAGSSDRVPSTEQAELARRLSPLYQIRSAQPPSLLMHGLEDAVVPPGQAKRFAAAYREAGNRCDLVLLPAAAHAFILTGYRAAEADVVAAICRVDGFLESLGWIKGGPTLTVSDPPAWTGRNPVKP